MISLKYNNAEIQFSLYHCYKTGETLEDEIKILGIKRDDEIALIPSQLVISRYQIVQALLYYMISDKIRRRYRTRGICIASLITGIRQIKDLTSILKKEYNKSNSYYVVCINKGVEKCRETLNGKCREISLSSLGENLEITVKNLREILELI